jgi:hypothetical protein
VRVKVRVGVRVSDNVCTNGRRLFGGISVLR